MSFLNNFIAKSILDAMFVCNNNSINSSYVTIATYVHITRINFMCMYITKLQLTPVDSMYGINF